MNEFTSPGPKPPTGMKRRNPPAQAALDANLREPVAEVDEALCRQIMEAVRQADATLPTPDPVPSRPGVLPWILPWAGAAAALGVVLLIGLRPPVDVAEPAGIDDVVATARSGHDPNSHPSNPSLVLARKEQRDLVSDTRQIATFLRENLRL